MLAVSTLNDVVSGGGDGRELSMHHHHHRADFHSYNHPHHDQPEIYKTDCYVSTSAVGHNGFDESFPMYEFPDISGAAGNSLLDIIDFDDLFVGIDMDLIDGNTLPDLEMDPNDLLAELSDGDGGGVEDEAESISAAGSTNYDANQVVVGGEVSCGKDSSEASVKKEFGSGEKVAEAETGAEPEEVSTVDNWKKDDGKKKAKPLSGKDNHGQSNCSNNNSNSSNGKRKVRVDWTPELHRRFVHAVEQLGVDKAVPSRILELMGIDCLTRHNIASHLQKYRSHRKHLLAREAEAASWSQKRHIYGAMAVPPPPPVVAAAGTSTAGNGGSATATTHANRPPWNGPTMGFPPAMTQPPPAPMHHHHPSFRPLHVWGHPHQPMMPMWPKHRVLPPSPTPIPMMHHLPLPHSWAKHPMVPPPMADPSFWHSHHQRVVGGVAPATPCFPSTLVPTTFPAQPVPGIPPVPPHPAAAAMYTHNKPGNGPPLDFHPTKESIDAAIGDVLSKPWLPLPIGLKPPAVDSVLVELQRQGVPEIPPASSTS